MFSVDSRTLARDGEAATAVGRHEAATAHGAGVWGGSDGGGAVL